MKSARVKWWNAQESEPFKFLSDIIGQFFYGKGLFLVLLEIETAFLRSRIVDV